MDEGMEGEGLARGGAALSPADGSTHRAWAFFPRAVKLGGGQPMWGEFLVPVVPVSVLTPRSRTWSHPHRTLS